MDIQYFNHHSSGAAIICQQQEASRLTRMAEQPTGPLEAWTGR
jgi:hypothetical protein